MPNDEQTNPFSFFHYLWKRKRDVNSPLDDPSINIKLPHTVVYEHNFPKGWYSWYGGASDGPKRRAGKEIDSEAVLRAFTKRSPHEDSSALVATYIERKAGEGNQPEYITNQWFDAIALKEWMSGMSLSPKHGILQKFVNPIGAHNEVIQVSWSPHVCVIEKRQNLKALNDEKVNAYERAVTYEGPSQFSKGAYIAPNTQAELKRVCRAIIEHIYLMEHKAVTRMTLYFKIDDAPSRRQAEPANMWLLWASILRLGSGDKGSASPQPIFRAPSKYRSDKASERSRNNELFENELNVQSPSMGAVGDVYMQYSNSREAFKPQVFQKPPSYDRTFKKKAPLERPPRPWAKDPEEASAGLQYYKVMKAANCEPSPTQTRTKKKGRTSPSKAEQIPRASTTEPTASLPMVSKNLMPAKDAATLLLADWKQISAQNGGDACPPLPVARKQLVAELERQRQLIQYKISTIDRLLEARPETPSAVGVPETPQPELSATASPVRSDVTPMSGLEGESDSDLSSGASESLPNTPLAVPTKAASVGASPKQSLPPGGAVTTAQRLKLGDWLDQLHYELYSHFLHDTSEATAVIRGSAGAPTPHYVRLPSALKPLYPQLRSLFSGAGLRTVFQACSEAEYNAWLHGNPEGKKSKSKGETSEEPERGNKFARPSDDEAVCFKVTNKPNMIKLGDRFGTFQDSLAA